MPFVDAAASQLRAAAISVGAIAMSRNDKCVEADLADGGGDDGPSTRRGLPVPSDATYLYAAECVCVKCHAP